MIGETTSTAGARFAAALVSKDFERIETLLAPEIDFRALTPGRAWEAHGSGEVIGAVLRQWLADELRLERVDEVHVEEFSDCQRVGYRLHGRNGDGPFVVEQQAYLQECAGRISWMRLLCSGPRPPLPVRGHTPPMAVETNDEAIAAWDGPLYDRFVRFRHVLTTGLSIHGERALELYPPRPGQRVLDIGCGFGDTTQRIGGLIGLNGVAVGVDAATRFIDTARREAAEAAVENVRFDVADVEQGVPSGPYDLAFSRFGTMFFANPVVALRNVRHSLTPGGRLVIVVWRRREDNEWLYRAQKTVEQLVTRPEEYDEPTCGPGPFSMANADTTTDILRHAGYTEIMLHRCDQPIMIGVDLEQAIDLMMALGPVGEILRLQGDRAKHLHQPVREALRTDLAELVTAEGVIAAASTWTVTAIPRT